MTHNRHRGKPARGRGDDFARRWADMAKRFCTPRAPRSPRPAAGDGATTGGINASASIGANASSTTSTLTSPPTPAGVNPPPAPPSAAPTCPICRHRPVDTIVCNACEPDKEVLVCAPCLDEAQRHGRSWYYVAWQAGMVSRAEVPDLDDYDDEEEDEDAEAEDGSAA
jgi:hypothetical protein